MNIRQFFSLTRFAQIVGGLVIILFVGWFLVMVLSEAKQSDLESLHVLQYEYQTQVDTCTMHVVGVDLLSLESRPVPPDVKNKCESDVLAANPFRYQHTSWERFKARVKFVFD